MGYLEKKFILHERDENGNLLPIDYECKELGGKLSIIPATRGELLRILAELRAIPDDDKKPDAQRNVWEDFVIRHIAKPELTKEDLSNVKLMTIDGRYKDIVDLLVDVIHKVSGIEVVTKGEEEVKKN
ncbi:MAG: hypothetical protein J7K62_02530 [Thermoplasmata archaeon]|nr:hypothetical protein [Thermoplasmata archaeon]